MLRAFAEQRGPFGLHLDFAGGTGRIAAEFTPFASRQFVLDISPTMLAEAARHRVQAILVQRDFREGLPELADGSVDVVTAFRFFANAEETLRADAMAFIARKLHQGGWLVCNNHRNFWSLPYIVRRFCFCGGDVGMSNRTLLDLASAHGFCLRKTFSLGVLPQSENRGVLSWKWMDRIERKLFSISGTRQRMGYNIVFVFERMTKNNSIAPTA